jgi:hypothetical protein
MSIFIMVMLLISGSMLLISGCGANQLGKIKKGLEISKGSIQTWQETIANAALDNRISETQETELAKLLDEARDVHNEVVAAARVAEAVPTEENQKTLIELNEKLTDLAIRTIRISAKYGLILDEGG